MEHNNDPERCFTLYDTAYCNPADIHASDFMDYSFIRTIDPVGDDISLENGLDDMSLVNDGTMPHGSYSLDQHEYSYRQQLESPTADWGANEETKTEGDEDEDEGLSRDFDQPGNFWDRLLKPFEDNNHDDVRAAAPELETSWYPSPEATTGPQSTQAPSYSFGGDAAQAAVINKRPLHDSPSPPQKREVEAPSSSSSWLIDTSPGSEPSGTWHRGRHSTAAESIILTTTAAPGGSPALPLSERGNCCPTTTLGPGDDRSCSHPPRAAGELDPASSSSSRSQVPCHRANTGLTSSLPGNGDLAAIVNGHSRESESPAGGLLRAAPGPSLPLGGQPGLGCTGDEPHPHPYASKPQLNSPYITQIPSRSARLSAISISPSPATPESGIPHAPPHPQEEMLAETKTTYPSPQSDASVGSESPITTPSATIVGVALMPDRHGSPISTTPATESAGRPRLAIKRDRDAPKNALGEFYCDHPDCSDQMRTFRRPCEWNKHMDKHDRPYKCQDPECEKLAGFTYSGGLLRHQREVHRMHTPTKRLLCPVEHCTRSSGKGFTRQENLKEHIRRLHSHNSAVVPDTDAAPGHTKLEETQPASPSSPGSRSSKRRRVSESPSLSLDNELRRLREELRRERSLILEKDLQLDQLKKRVDELEQKVSAN